MATATLGSFNHAEGAGFERGKSVDLRKVPLAAMRAAVTCSRQSAAISVPTGRSRAQHAPNASQR